MSTFAPTLPCPRCDGSGRIAACADYHNGRCYLCSGTGKVDARQVHARRDPVPTGPFRTITLPSFGPTIITRDGTGFLATFADGWLLFGVQCDTIVPHQASDGIIARLATQKVARELQALLKKSSV